LHTEPNHACRLRARPGFTLVEILIAALILTIGVISVLWVISDSLQGARRQHERQIATSLAQAKLEELRNISYQDLASGVEEDEYGEQILLDEYGRPGGIYSRQWVVTEGSPMEGTKTVTVTVAWEEGVPDGVSVMTIVARPFPEGML